MWGMLMFGTGMFGMALATALMFGMFGTLTPTLVQAETPTAFTQP